MNCALFQWAAAQRGISAHLSGVLLRLIPLMDEDGNLSLPQKEIAPFIGVGERQTRAGIAALVEAGVLIRKRRGGIGAGRVADMLSANLARNATGDMSPLSEQPAAKANCDNGGTSPLANGGNAQPAMGGKSPLAVADVATGDNAATSPLSGEKFPETVDNSPAHIEHGRARADSNLKYTTPSELNPETPSQVVIVAPASSDRPPPPAWQRVLDAVRSPHLDENKNQRLILEGAIVQRWIDAGADLELDVIPTVRRLIEAKSAPVPWKFFTNAVRETAARRIAAEAQLAPITAEEANAHDHRTGDTDPGVRRRPRSALTQRAMQLMSER